MAINVDCFQGQSFGNFFPLVLNVPHSLQILLSIAAVVSLALGLFQDFGTPRPTDDPPVDWVEGVAIMVAVFIVVSYFAHFIIIFNFNFLAGNCRLCQ